MHSKVGEIGIEAGAKTRASTEHSGRFSKSAQRIVLFESGSKRGFTENRFPGIQSRPYIGSTIWYQREANKDGVNIGMGLEQVRTSEGKKRQFANQIAPTPWRRKDRCRQPRQSERYRVPQTHTRSAGVQQHSRQRQVLQELQAYPNRLSAVMP